MIASEYQDISIGDEEQLPLPEGWIRSMKISLSEGGLPTNSDLIYKNVNTGQESDEHPYIVKALNLAR
jgi:hypothetical protein